MTTGKRKIDLGKAKAPCLQLLAQRVEAANAPVSFDPKEWERKNMARGIYSPSDLADLTGIPEERLPDRLRYIKPLSKILKDDLPSTRAAERIAFGQWQDRLERGEAFPTEGFEKGSSSGTLLQSWRESWNRFTLSAFGKAANPAKALKKALKDFRRTAGRDYGQYVSISELEAFLTERRTQKA